MSFALKLPYYAPHTPYALPSKEEIKAALLISDYSAQRVAQVGHHFIVKYGPQVSVIEGENLIYIRQATTVLVPQVYAIFTDCKEDCNSLSWNAYLAKRSPQRGRT